MFCTQTRIQDEPIVLTSVVLKERAVVDEYTYDSKIPEEFQHRYNLAIFEHGLFYQDLSDLFHQLYPNPPYSAKHFIDLLKNQFGFSVTVRCFTNIQEIDLKGRWKWDDDSMRNFTVWVNDALPDSAKKLTIIHECLHAVQDIDPNFLTMLGNQPEPLRRSIADRIAEKCAVEIVMPYAEYQQCRRKGWKPAKIADVYCASMSLICNYKP